MRGDLRSALTAVPAQLRGRAARAPHLRDAVLRLRAARRAIATPGGQPPFTEIPPDAALRLAYNVVLQRDPDPVGAATLLPPMRQGTVSYREAVSSLMGSEEFSTLIKFWQLSPSLHASRCAFIRSLPAGRRILDLGGTHLGREEGALVVMGYPYPFDELVIIDLPMDDRHRMYRCDLRDEVLTELGPVRYRYHSMVDLSAYEDDSFDLVYSGQTFEHVTEEEGDAVLRQVRRVLRPGGHLALDTPNGRATRMQQDEFIDPDHKVEYDEETLTAKILDAGLEVLSVQGLNYLGESARTGVFSVAETARNSGVYARARDCYLLAYVCRKPART